MANEITVNVGMSRQHATNTVDKHSIPIARSQYTQTGTGQSDTKPSIGTSEEAAAFVDIATNGWIYMQNMDTTNYVEWGTTGAYIGRMRAQETAGPFRLNAGATLYLRANTAACRVRIVMYED